MKYEDISKNGYPLGFLIKKVEDKTKKTATKGKSKAKSTAKGSKE